MTLTLKPVAQLKCPALGAALAVFAAAAPMLAHAQAREPLLLADLAPLTDPLIGLPPMLLTGSAVQMAGTEMGSRRRVTGAPYCADAVSESAQILADGNRISRKTATRLCRDSEGRTRQEIERNGNTRIFIHDPVARAQWALDPANKTAVRLDRGPNWQMGDPAARLQPMPGHDDEWRKYAERMREWAQQFRERVRGEASTTATKPAAPAAPASSADSTPTPVVISEVSTGPGGNTTVNREVRVYRIGDPNAMAPHSGPMPSMPPMPPMGAMQPMPPMPPMPANVQIFGGDGPMRFAPPRGEGVTTSLGSKDMEGVRANGERTTWTIEAGKIGNEKPINITRERWTSPDLMLTLFSRDFDPRAGESTYKLTNLKRGEPDANLFKVPAGYTVREAPRPPMPPMAPAVPTAPAAPVQKG
ncbi:hypothetical protein IP84_12470 [beta proteobacterium AAP99]|nr:hypothetical protein IP84_12470 [beta proteobacterium AAP99]